MKHLNLIPFVIAASLIGGCGTHSSAPAPELGPHELVRAENHLFLQQKNYDPWVLVNADPGTAISAYLPSGGTGTLYGAVGTATQTFFGGQYSKNGVIVSTPGPQQGLTPAAVEYKQTLNLQSGTLTTVSETSSTSAKSSVDWSEFWKASDISIIGDPEAQQVTHSELFYLCGSLDAGTDHSIPPMGLSSNVYNGHIFWDAEIWMMPAVLPQHPDLAKSIVDYRFKRLSAAESLAKKHGYKGAEFPWESAATGREEAPPEFSQERHITADVAYAAWNYYLWTGDKTYLAQEGWPILSETAAYWVSRVKLGSDGDYHIASVIGPDETAELVTDDAWTNAVVSFNLSAADAAAAILGKLSDPTWSKVAAKIYIPYDPKAKMYLEYPAMDRGHLQAKQADTQMLIYPLNVRMSPIIASNTLDFCLKHTIHYGPAMTSSIDSVVAAKLGRAQQSLDLYHDSFRPFMRGPWDAFSEKRTKSDVYFTTGMGGNLQAVLYGFAGLNVNYGTKNGNGTLIERNGDAGLYADPHLPPGWSGLVLNGVRFRGTSYTVTIKPGNIVSVVKK
jgi:trehalose/maltose hydrolase-like predicted phosphorylase